MLEQYYRINEATGVNVAIAQDGNVAIAACSVSIANNKLNFEKKLTDLVNIDELSKHLPAKTIIALNLSGKGIIQKQTEKIEDIDQNNFNKILPNAKLEDFYVQNFISGNQSFVSIIRKTEADKWINQLNAAGFAPLMLSLGPFPVQNIISQVNIYGNEIIFNDHNILRNEQLEWISYQYNESDLSPFPLKVESESISEKLLIPYAVAFQLVLANSLPLISADVPPLQADFKRLVEGKKIKVQSSLILCGFFALLLANFFWFSWLNSNNAKLTDQVSISAQSSEDIQKINDEIQQKEALLKTLGWENAINKSVLIDQVASLLPQEVSWREAAIDPIDLSGSRNQRTSVFFNRKIRIMGNSEKIIPVNEWIARIKTQAWVKNVQLDSYAYNNELNTGQFTILIDY